MWKLLDKKGNILYQHTHAHSLLSFPKSHSCPGRACRNKIQAVLFSMLTWLLALSAPAPALSLGHLPRDCSLPFIFSLASQGNFQTPCSFHRAKGVELIIQQFPLEHPPLHPTPARPLGSPFSFSAPYGTLPRTASQEQEGLQEEAKMGESSGIFRAMKSQKQSWGRLVHGGGVSWHGALTALACARTTHGATGRLPSTCESVLKTHTAETWPFQKAFTWWPGKDLKDVSTKDGRTDISLPRLLYCLDPVGFTATRYAAMA